MIWSYFPIGMSYPVDDFSDQTKKRCWNTTLSALMAAEKENWTETSFFDFCAENYPGSSEKEYVCILSQRHVTQTRVTVPMFRKQDRLRPQLSLHYPFYMANALDDFGPYINLGEISKEGVYSVTEEGRNILPETIPQAMPANIGKRILIAMNSARTGKGYTETLRQVASIAAEKGMRIDYCPLANGTAGTAYSVTYAKEGRFEWLKGRKIPSYLGKILLGILPGHAAIWDCEQLNSVTGQPVEADLFGETVKAVLDLGYRNIIFSVDGYSDQGVVSKIFLDNNEPRLSECSFTVLTSNPALINGSVVSNGNVFQLIRMGALLCYAPDYIADATELAEKGKAADLILLEKDSIPGVTDTFAGLLDTSKCRVIDFDPMNTERIGKLLD